MPGYCAVVPGTRVVLSERVSMKSNAALSWKVTDYVSSTLKFSAVGSIIHGILETAVSSAKTSLSEGLII